MDIVEPGVHGAVLSAPHHLPQRCQRFLRHPNARILDDDLNLPVCNRDPRGDMNCALRIRPVVNGVLHDGL